MLRAHHAFAAEFDANKHVKFEKPLSRNGRGRTPHVWIYIDVKKPDGTVEAWAIEAGTPNLLFRRGFTREALKPGTEITVERYAAKDGSKRANGRDSTFPDGRCFSSDCRAPALRLKSPNRPPRALQN